jgi:hypothetical protein
MNQQLSKKKFGLKYSKWNTDDGAKQSKTTVINKKTGTS